LKSKNAAVFTGTALFCVFMYMLRVKVMKEGFIKKNALVLNTFTWIQVQINHQVTEETKLHCQLPNLFKSE
jgi:hypothetical protein